MLEDPGNEGAASPDTTALDLMQNLTLQSPPSSSHPMLSEDENDIIDDIIEVLFSLTRIVVIIVTGPVMLMSAKKV